MTLKYLLFGVGLTCLFISAYAQLPNPALPCPAAGSNVTCQLPKCLCSAQNIPGGLTPSTIPQIVYLTFDDAVNVQNYAFYESAFSNRYNPNNSTISVTYFATHEYNNYPFTHQLWRNGHEIALHSITHQTNTQYWVYLNETQWKSEFVDQRDQMARFANIPLEDLKGIRSPFLQLNGNEAYTALKKGNLTWDCSRPTWNQRSPGLWPYTNDYRSTQDCQIAPCPTASFPGFWTVPMIDLLGNDSFPCAMVDQCNPAPENANTTYELLLKNFNVQYNGNRAPFGVFTHAAWLIGDDPPYPERRAGYLRFLDYLGTKNDTYIVSVSKALEWVKNPTRLANINSFVPWQPQAVKTENCLNFNCRYVWQGSERYMPSCIQCPINYPWLGNPFGV